MLVRPAVSAREPASGTQVLADARRIPAGLVLILVVFLALGTLYSVMVPVFEAPDELHHYFYVRHLATGNSLPVQDPQADQPWAQEGSQPPLYYALAGLLTSWISTDDALLVSRPNLHVNLGVPLDPGNKNRVVHSPLASWPYHNTSLAVHIARWFSLLLATGTILCTYAIARRLLPRRPYMALAASAVNAFIPQFVFISAAVTNDNLVILLAALTTWQLVRLLQEPHTRPRLLLLGLTLGLAALTKLSGLGLIPLAIAVLFLQAWRQHRRRELIRDLALTLLPALVVAGWWYWRNWRLYGDPTGLNIMLQIVGPRVPPPGLAQLPSEFQGLRISFWGLFGWFNVPFPSWVYTLLDWLSGLTAVGLLIGLLRLGWRARRESENGGGVSLRDLQPLYWVLLLLLTWVGILSAALVRWTRLTPGTQGRLMFPALPALAILLILGWAQLLPISGRIKRVWLSIWPALLLALTVYAPFAVIKPAYAAPPKLSPEDVPAEAVLDSPIQFGEVARLLGAEVSPPVVRPGEEVVVTLYWQALREVPYDLSLFIHLLGHQNQVVGQLDTYPGWGNYATSLWKQGEVFADTYRVPVRWDAQAPTLVRVDVGLYYAPTQRGLPARREGYKTMPGVIGTVRLVPASNPSLEARFPADFDFNGLVTLRGYDYSALEVAPGQPITVTLYWQDVARMGDDFTVFVHLLGPDGQKVTQKDQQPLEGDYPTSVWQPGDMIVDHYRLTVPADAKPGAYRPLVGLYLPATLERVLVGSQEGEVRNRGALLAPIMVR